MFLCGHYFSRKNIFHRKVEFNLEQQTYFNKIRILPTPHRCNISVKNFKPLIWLMSSYVNYMPEAKKSNCLFYADDLEMLKKLKNN